MRFVARAFGVAGAVIAALELCRCAGLMGFVPQPLQHFLLNQGRVLMAPTAVACLAMFLALSYRRPELETRP